MPEHIEKSLNEFTLNNENQLSETSEPSLPKLNTDYKYQWAAEADKIRDQGKNPEETHQIDIPGNFDRGIER